MGVDTTDNALEDTRVPDAREEEEEETGAEERRPTRTRMTKNRRRACVATVEGGRLRRDDTGPGQNGRAPSQLSRIWPRRDGVISPGMADPNRNIIGYQSQEVPVASARTSGVFWSTSRTRDNRRFPGAAEKTLHRQSLESVSAEGTVAGGEGEDLLLWPGVRPPEVGPG